MKRINIIFWILSGVGILGLLLSGSRIAADSEFVRLYTTVLQLYLLGFTAFLVLKRVFFYRLKGNINIVRMVQTSPWQQGLLLQGLILVLLFLTYLYRFGSLLSFDTVMIGILLFYYGTQVLEHGRPSVYIDDRSFSYDDYLVEEWPWRKIESINLDDEQLRLLAPDGNFELDFASIDEVDIVRLNDELARGVLDGEFASHRTSKSLKDIILNYAQANDIHIRKS